MSTSFLYSNDLVGIKILDDKELSGGYANWFSDEKVHQFNSHWSYPKSRTSIEQYIRELDSDSSRLIFAIYDVSDKVHVGNISVQSSDHFNQKAELAFLFGEKAYWGGGRAHSATKIIIRHCFNHLNLNRLYLGCLEENVKMVNLAEALGFKLEGVRRQDLFSNGAFSDVKIFGLLKKDYQSNS